MVTGYDVISSMRTSYFSMQMRFFFHLFSVKKKKKKSRYQNQQNVYIHFGWLHKSPHKPTFRPKWLENQTSRTDLDRTYCTYIAYIGECLASSPTPPPPLSAREIGALHIEFPYIHCILYLQNVAIGHDPCKHCIDKKTLTSRVKWVSYALSTVDQQMVMASY